LGVDLGVAVPRVADDRVREPVQVLPDLVPPGRDEGEGQGARERTDEGARAGSRAGRAATAGAGSGVKGRGVPAGRRRGHDQRGSLVALAARAGAVQQRTGLARHAAIVLDLPLLHVLLEPPRVAARERVVRLARVGVLHRRLQHASRRAVEGEEQATTGAAVEPMHLLRVGTGPWAATWGQGAGAGAGAGPRRLEPD